MASTKGKVGSGSALVVGVGPGLGGATCRALGTAGYHVWGVGRTLADGSALVRDIRSDVPDFAAVSADACDPEQMSSVIAKIAATGPPLRAVVYNAARLHIGRLEELDAAEFEAVWRACCLGAMVTAKLCLPVIAANGGGAATFIGATASLRGGARFTAFASAKFALRGLVQSLARDYWPRGVHVSHLILDGIIGESSGQLSPAAIAGAIVALAAQPASAWTQELDLRPNSEAF